MTADPGRAVAPKKSKAPIAIIAIIVLAASCVPCIGIVAAVAIPSFIQYVRKSKISEAESNLRSLHAGATSYYLQEQIGGGAVGATHCTVGSAITPNTPGPEKTVLGPLDPAFDALGFAPYEPSYFQYEIIAPPSSCGHGPNEALYTFRAYGDLDGDGISSTFELTANSDSMNELMRTPAIRVDQELE